MSDEKLAYKTMELELAMDVIQQQNEQIEHLTRDRDQARDDVARLRAENEVLADAVTVRRPDHAVGILQRMMDDMAAEEWRTMAYLPEANRDILFRFEASLLPGVSMYAVGRYEGGMCLFPGRSHGDTITHWREIPRLRKAVSQEEQCNQGGGGDA